MNKLKLPALLCLTALAGVIHPQPSQARPTTGDPYYSLAWYELDDPAQMPFMVNPLPATNSVLVEYYIWTNQPAPGGPIYSNEIFVVDWLNDPNPGSTNKYNWITNEPTVYEPGNWLHGLQVQNAGGDPPFYIPYAWRVLCVSNGWSDIQHVPDWSGPCKVCSGDQLWCIWPPAVLTNGGPFPKPACLVEQRYYNNGIFQTNWVLLQMTGLTNYWTIPALPGNGYQPLFELPLLCYTNHAPCNPFGTNCLVNGTLTNSPPPGTNAVITCVPIASTSSGSTPTGAGGPFGWGDGPPPTPVRTITVTYPTKGHLPQDIEPPEYIRDLFNNSGCDSFDHILPQLPQIQQHQMQQQQTQSPSSTNTWLVGWFDVHGLPGTIYKVQFSVDRSTWTDLDTWHLMSSRGAAEYFVTTTNAPPPTTLYYRVDQSD